MTQRTAVIITSISSHDNMVLQQIAKGCAENNFAFYLVGDVQSPAGFSLDGCTYMDIASQRQMGSRLAGLLPERCYARKNLGYIAAIRNNCAVIVETDDDNVPMPSFWDARKMRVEGVAAGAEGWFNVYRHFSEEHVWPRGFPLELVHSQKQHADKRTAADAPVQQSLADCNPDVDAMYRMTRKLPVYFRHAEAVVLSAGTFCPFNSQNTTWFREAFALLYLPAFATFRMTDIWRSFIAQRILWTMGRSLSFHAPTVEQHRNHHDLWDDFRLEMPGYLKNGSIMSMLCRLQLREGHEHIPENMRRCYEAMVRGGYLDARELKLVDAWLTDIA